MERAGARFEEVRIIFGMAAGISHESPCQLSNQGRAAHKEFARSVIETQPRPIGPFAVPRRRATGGRYLVAQRILVPGRHLRHPRHAVCANFEMQADTTHVAGHNRHGPQCVPVSLLPELGLDFSRRRKECTACWSIRTVCTRNPVTDSPRFIAYVQILETAPSASPPVPSALQLMSVIVKEPVLCAATLAGKDLAELPFPDVISRIPV